MDALFVNQETNMAAEVDFVNRKGPKYRVLLRDLDSGNIVPNLRFFVTLEDASAYAADIADVRQYFHPAL